MLFVGGCVCVHCTVLFVGGCVCVCGGKGGSAGEARGDGAGDCTVLFVGGCVCEGQSVHVGTCRMVLCVYVHTDVSGCRVCLCVSAGLPVGVGVRVCMWALDPLTMGMGTGIAT